MLALKFIANLNVNVLSVVCNNGTRITAISHPLLDSELTSRRQKYSLSRLCFDRFDIKKDQLVTSYSNGILRKTLTLQPWLSRGPKPLQTPNGNTPSLKTFS